MNKQEIEKAISLLKSDIGVLDNYLKKHPLVISHYLEKDRCIENQLIKDMEFTISALEHQLTNGWIPVSKRLPEENGHYLVTYHEWSKGEYLPEFDFTCVKILRFYHGEFKMPVCCNDKIEQDIGREVLAWRELPDPYKEVSE